MSSLESRKSTARTPHSPAAGHQFVQTSWTAILIAGRENSEQAKEALSQLCRCYWGPLHSYVRRLGYSEHDAQDLTQEFFVELIERNLFGAADRKKGKFRSFLLTALQHFLTDQKRRAGAFKRRANKLAVSLDEADEEGRPLHEPAGGESPVREYERRWALTLFQQAFLRLRQEYAGAGKSALFESIKEFIEGTGQGSYGPVAAELKMTANAVGVAVHRLRQSFAQLVRAEIANTLAHPTAEEIEAERRHLFEVLGQ